LASHPCDDGAFLSVASILTVIQASHENPWASHAYRASTPAPVSGAEEEQSIIELRLYQKPLEAAIKTAAKRLSEMG
jgi:hypothetical protein